MYDKIIISLALDHGISQNALAAARGLLNEGGEITAVHVYEPLHGSAATFVTEDAVAKALQSAKDRLAERVANAKGVKPLLLKGHPGRAITEHAKKVGADVGKVLKDIKSDKVEAQVKEDMAEAQKFGFTGTPGFLINGVSVKGAYPFDHFKMIIDKHLEK